MTNNGCKHKTMRSTWTYIKINKLTSLNIEHPNQIIISKNYKIILLLHSAYTHPIRVLGFYLHISGMGREKFQHQKTIKMIKNKMSCGGVVWEKEGLKNIIYAVGRKNSEE